MKKINLSKLESIINYKFEKKSFLKKSLTHKSFDPDINNEKLEFLGDRVLGLIIAKNLILKYPKDNEGILDKKFANLVNKKKCAYIAEKINLKKFMYLGENYKKKDQTYEKISGDCLEALIGAIFIDNGIKAAEKFILRYWESSIQQSIETIVDSKTKLQEFCLKKYKKLPLYTLEKKSGPDHKPLFKVYVQIPNSKKIASSGTSKKEAQQNAAQILIKELKI